MMHRPLVSVIVVVKNGEDYLHHALQSIADQDYFPVEMIVVDGQSTDQTARIARTVSQVKYLWQGTLGLANARNQGVAVARGDLVAFLDHDDLWAPSKLSTQVHYLEDHHEVDYTITYVRFFSDQTLHLRPGFKKQSFEAGQIGCTPGALLARREVFDRVGGFEPDLSIGCDADWFARARDLAIPMYVIPEVLLFKRIHNANLSANVRLNKQELLTVIRQSIERKRHIREDIP